MSEQQQEGRRERPARDEAVIALVSNMVALGLQLAIMLAVLKRDSLWRCWRRYQWQVRQEWRGTAERLAVAELRRDISRMEHEGIPGV